MKLSRFAKFAWFVLAYNVAVILWGAYVRISFSGDGCGDHWPKCNGAVIPDLSSTKTLIEFSHRGSTGLLGLLTLALTIWAFRAFAAKHPVRKGVMLSLVFLVIEALFGAVLVKRGLVNRDDSAARAVVMSLHLINTMILTAGLALTAWWASGGARLRISRQKGLAVTLSAGLLLTLLLGITGAIVALGDTLFPAKSLAEGMQQDFSPTAHFLLRLRIIHPLLAFIVAGYAIVTTIVISALRTDQATVRLSRMVIAHFGIQIFVGLANLLLLAPNWMQLLHLFTASLVWISLVLFSASALSAAENEAMVTAPDNRLHNGSAEADPLSAVHS